MLKSGGEWGMPYLRQRQPDPDAGGREPVRQHDARSQIEAALVNVLRLHDVAAVAHGLESRVPRGGVQNVPSFVVDLREGHLRARGAQGGFRAPNLKAATMRPRASKESTM